MKLPKLIGFCGKLASGKDTYGDLYRQLAEESGYNIKHYSFATPLKAEVDSFINDIREWKNWSEVVKKHNISLDDYSLMYDLVLKELDSNLYVKSTDRTPGIRKILQYWGTDIRRKQNSNYWTDKAYDFIKEQTGLGNIVYITDARFINEFDVIKKSNGILVKLEATDNERIKRVAIRDNIEVSKDALNHKSELDVNIYNNFDYVLNTEKDSIENNFENIKKYLKGMEAQFE